MHLDPAMLVITIALFCSMLIAYVSVRLRQPIAVAYILTGVVLGPSGLAVIEDHELVTRIGEIGVVMLLFFVGMEVSIPRLMEGWRIAFVGTYIQIMISVAICVGLVVWLGMEWQLGVLFGFIISLSSTAVVLKMLQDSGELDLPMGQNALGILLVQDMAIIPMMVILGLIGSTGISVSEISIQVLGGIGIVAFVLWLMRSGRFYIPYSMISNADQSMMLGLLLCLGSASLTAWLGLSPGLGAFLAGMLLASSDQAEEWVHEHLGPIHVIFMAMFFISIGLLVDFTYFLEHIEVVLGVTILVLLFNAGTNTFVLRSLGEDWETSLLTAGLLSQIGEFSFLLAAVGLHAGLMNVSLHSMTVLVIAMTLMLSPLWHTMIKRFARVHDQIE
jgi:CPA2 family monovalent cation:H+ antiporter-2